MTASQSSTRRGSTKIITAVREGVLSFHLTDGWSTHDRGTSRQPIPGMGKSRCACAVQSFDAARKAGLPTHYIEQVSGQDLHVEEFAVPGAKSLSGKVHGQVIPLEWIWRMVVSRRVVERVEAGTLRAEDLGLEPGTKVVEGMKLPKIFLECSTKFEEVDRMLSDEEAFSLSGLTRSQWQEACELIVAMVDVLVPGFKRAGFLLKDGKFELGLLNTLRNNGCIVFVDVFGTQDENRIVDIATGDIYDKDLIRLHLEATSWYQELKAAKVAYPHDKSKWPQYLRLPGQVVNLVSHRYSEVARRRAGTHII